MKKESSIQKANVRLSLIDITTVFFEYTCLTVDVVQAI